MSEFENAPVADHVASTGNRATIRSVMTGVVSLGVALVGWIVSVGILDPIFRSAHEDLIWALPLWFFSLLSTGIAGYSRHASHPVLACTITFAIFSVVFMACEGPIFGVVSEGGDPMKTKVVVSNLICLPLGVFVASVIGDEMKKRVRRQR